MRHRSRSCANSVADVQDSNGYSLKMRMSDRSGFILSLRDKSSAKNVSVDEEEQMQVEDTSIAKCLGLSNSLTYHNDRV